MARVVVGWQRFLHQDSFWSFDLQPVKMRTRYVTTTFYGVTVELDLVSLQHDFALVDLMSRPSRGRSGVLEQLILKHENIKIKMYQEKKHARAHFHVDYGRSNHVATYAIDTGERIEGSLDRKYDRAVSGWTVANRENLIALWEALQAGVPESQFIQSLPALQ